MSGERRQAPASNVVATAALVAVVAIVGAVVLFLTGDDALQRLAVLVGVVGLIVPSIAASLRADQAASSSHKAAEQTNGTLDARIAAAVAEALQARRATDHVVVTQAPRPGDADPLTVPELERRIGG